VDAIAHLASPVTFSAGDPNELIEPAVKGTVGILESAFKHGGENLKRVVILSSAASVSGPEDTGEIDENNWNESAIREVHDKKRDASQASKYQASKSLAEKAAWEFVSKHPSSGTEQRKWDLVTLCPPFVYGPIKHDCDSASHLNETMKAFYTAVLKPERPVSEFAAWQASWIDVRDLARAHTLALEKEEAGGRRFLLSSGPYIWQDWYDTVNSLQIPGLPDSVPIGDPGAGKSFAFKKTYRSDAAKDILGVTFRDKATTARDIVVNFQERGFLS